jgi:hypothetical protein
MEATCPYCGEDADFCGLDVLHQADGIDFATWQPCCEGMLSDVTHYGFEEVYGRTVENTTGTLTGTDVREVYEGDGVLRRPLSVHNPGPGVKGWQTEVFELVNEHHRHHPAPQGWKFGVAVYNGRATVGVAVVGRPVSRILQAKEPGTLEVTRVCTFGDRRLRRNAASKLYAACGAEARARGYDKLVTYTLAEENASSLRAANFVPVARTEPRSWNRPRRSRIDKAPTCAKVRWERGLSKKARKAISRKAIDCPAGAPCTSKLNVQHIKKKRTPNPLKSGQNPVLTNAAPTVILIVEGGLR